MDQKSRVGCLYLFCISMVDIKILPLKPFHKNDLHVVFYTEKHIWRYSHSTLNLYVISQ